MSTNETHVTVRGRLCADPSVFTTKAGAPMTRFRMAQSGRRPVPGQPGQWEDTEASFYDVLAYRSLAANIGVSLKKGHPVAVHGRQRVTQWRREDGQVFVNVEIEADAVGHDLTYGTTAFARVGLARPAEVPSDPERDAYVVEPGPGGGPGELAGGPGAQGFGAGGTDVAGEEVDEPGTDSGPLVPPPDEAAA